MKPSRSKQSLLLCAFLGVPLLLFLFMREQASWRPRVLECDGWVSSLAFSPDGKWLTAGAVGQTRGRYPDNVRVWDAHTGRLRWSQNLWLDNADLIAKDRQNLIVAGSDKVQIRDIRTGKKLRDLFLGKHPTQVRNVAVSRSGNMVAILLGSSDSSFASVALCKVPNGKVRYISLPPKRIEYRSLAFLPDGKRLIVQYDQEGEGGQYDLKRVYPSIGYIELKSGRFRRGWRLRTSPREVSYSLDGRLMATSHYSPDVSLRDTRSSRLLKTFKGSSSVMTITFSPDGRLLAAVYQDGSVLIWDVVTGHIQRTLTVSNKSALSLAFSPDGSTLATGGTDGWVRLWRMK